MQDLISDMLTRIRNAQKVLKPEVSVPFSKINFQIAQILEKEGFIAQAERRGRTARKQINILLQYQEKTPRISGLKRISKPGQRKYLPAKSIKPIRGGFGLAIISTSQGIMTDKEARKRKVGGEVICEIW